jgi:hypothetical protein
VTHVPVWETNINQRLQKKLDASEAECERLRAALQAVRDVQDLGDAAQQIIAAALSHIEPISISDIKDNP